ncbi:hypothetical protein HanRHA438_Chr12g0552281 [Helianthus annuus]|nr:hypothetical protein HanHA300_Chr12g0443451 [Helianthus annuus]KAJ0493182.1 hypothetical protein HanIR_Chr12g0583251 [Helianthus annuus]KAJ0674947.1 hypothetical protein HanLR1_Chr12g0445671 [Helianthus annuus]KAJ0866483.1 hypothetical protein HanRHA438_Chr12g0552281 [Helianthus annuus]
MVFQVPSFYNYFMTRKISKNKLLQHHVAAFSKEEDKQFMTRKISKRVNRNFTPGV